MRNTNKLKKGTNLSSNNSRGTNKKNYVLRKNYLNGRIVLLNKIFFLLFLLMGVKVAEIKLVKGEEYTKGALGNMLKSESVVLPQRGNIVDRNNKLLATSILSYDVILSPKDILGMTENQQQQTYETLESVLGQEIAHVKKIVEDRPASRYYVIANKVEKEVADNLKNLGGVTLQKTYRRTYPSGESAAQIIGFFSRENKGQYGIEEQYEDYLKGKPGREFSQMQDNKVVTRQLQDPKNGSKIVLTLDEIIQQYVSKTMEKYIEQYKPINASAIIMNPKTGEIYSMYSYPTYDPNTYHNLSDQLGQAVWDQLSQEKKTESLLSAWKNHTMQYIYEPGSTMKPIIMAMALEENVIKGNETYVCHGHSTVEDRNIGCWKQGGHGVQTLEEVLANSCNVGMIELTQNMDNDIFLEYIKRFGFGEPTGIQLAGEEKGLLHTKLGDVDKATYSMGQNLNVTPLQLVTAFSAVVNGGYLMEPYIVKSVIDDEGNTVLNSKNNIRREIISSDVSAKVTEYMRRVVDDGTGTAAAIAGYDIGGKTGTGEKWVNVDGKLQRPKDEYVVSFIGTAPISNPEVVGLVVFDGLPDKTGASSAAFREMMEDILPYLDIELKGGAVGAEELVTTVPDINGKTIYDAVSTLESKELEYEIVGIGTKVVEQIPKAGETWHKGGNVKIYVESNNMSEIEVVPNLIGKTQEEAQAIIGENFILEGSVKGTIESQFPPEKTKIEKGNNIIIK